MGRGVDAVKRAQWRRRLQRFERSDWTVAEFCLEEQVSPATFYYWKKRLAAVGSDSHPPKESTGFAMVRVVGTAGVTVRLPGGASVEIAAGDVESLRLVMETLVRLGTGHSSVPPC